MESSLASESTPRLRRLVGLWAPVALLMAAIFVVSSVPDVGPLPADVSDKTAHFIVYGVLAAATARALARGRWAAVTLSVAAGAWAISTIYGGTDEFHQRFVIGRSASIADWWADALGSAAGAVLVLVVAELRRLRRRAV